MAKFAAVIGQHPRQIVYRTHGHRHGPVTRLMSPSDLGQNLKPFVFLDLFDDEGSSFSGFGWHPHSGIATLTYLWEGSIRYEDTTGAAGFLPAGAPPAPRKPLRWGGATGLTPETPSDVVPKPAQAHEPEVPVKVREWITSAPASPALWSSPATVRNSRSCSRTTCQRMHMMVNIPSDGARALDAKAAPPISKATGTVSGNSCEVWDFTTFASEAQHLAAFVASEMKKYKLGPRDFSVLVRMKAAGPFHRDHACLMASVSHKT